MAVSSTTSSPIMMRPPPPPGPMRLNKISCEQFEEPSSSSPDFALTLGLEFDGTTVLCRVCGDKASGFHYGVHSCEGCKGFFRRSIQQKIQYRPCTKNQQCSILRINRNRCQYCRLKKCIAVGMSRDAVRFGRVPKREKAKILAAMQKSSNARTQEQALTTELEDEHKLMSTVIRAHMETCDFTRDKVEPMILSAREHPNYAVCSNILACPLNPTPQPLSGQQEILQDFSARFSPAIRGVVDFAKRIPGFSVLAQDDQVTLLKAAVFEVLLVRLARMFDSETKCLLCLNGQQVQKESVNNNLNARFLLDSMFEFADRLNRLRLSDPEIGLFCSVIVITPDRPGLRNTELIERMQNKLKSCLQVSLSHSHAESATVYHELLRKVPDLRTLNTLHSEKLLAFKMTEHQQQQQQQHRAQWEDQWAHIKEEVMYDDGAKSPLGSVSSTEESVCSGEVSKLTELRGPVTVMAPSIRMCPHAADVMASLSPKRRRDNSEGAGSDGDESSSMVDSPKMRKLDSPSDSGIESGPEKTDKSSLSPPMSECSSPRSSVEDAKDSKDVESEPIDDMPVLKRALQAPPLYDTNLLMDEAYKPHKKFRALRKGTPEPECPSSAIRCPARSTSSSACSSPARCSPSSVSSRCSPLSARSSPVQHHQSGASFIASHVYGNSNSSTTTSVLSAALMAPSLSTPTLSASLSTSLSSTHSTLAKSLMEGPKSSAEQRKRADILHTIIMKSEAKDGVYTIPCSEAAYATYFNNSPPQPQSQLQQQLQRPPAPVWPSLPTSPPTQQRRSSPFIRTVYAPSPSPPTLSTTLSPLAQALVAGPKAMGIQLGIDTQPLNLSKKTPPPPTHRNISLEA